MTIFFVLSLKLLIIFVVGFVFFSKKFQRKLIGRQDDADTDSHSDSDFDGNENSGANIAMSEEDKLKAKYGNLELLEKRFENFSRIFYFLFF